MSGNINNGKNVMQNLTPSELFYIAGMGKLPNPAPHRCYYCGASCDDSFRTKDYVQETFTNRDVVLFPGSQFCCPGCVEAAGAGPDEMEMLDGTIRVRENLRGMQPRMYSWIITKGRRWAATKAHIAQLREFILNPPEPPFCVVLADSGQKQLLFRAAVAHDRDRFPVLLEDHRIMVDRVELSRALEAADLLAEAIGKPALLVPLTMSLWISCQEHHGTTDPMEAWGEWRNTETGKLAAWLAKTKGKTDGN